MNVVMLSVKKRRRAHGLMALEQVQKQSARADGSILNLAIKTSNIVEVKSRPRWWCQLSSSR